MHDKLYDEEFTAKEERDLLDELEEKFIKFFIDEIVRYEFNKIRVKENLTRLVVE